MAQDTTTQVEGQIDIRLLDFVREKANTFVKWDLLRFFHDNPHAVNTADNIARFAGRDVRQVEADLDELVEQGIIDLMLASDKRVYRFVKDEAVRATVGQFVIACDDPNFRVQAINRVIEGLQ